MGSNHTTGSTKQWMVRRWGFLIEHIRAIATKMAGFEGTDHGTGIYQFTTTGIDDIGTLGEKGEAVGINQVMGTLGKGEVQADNIGMGEGGFNIGTREI